MVPRVSMMSMVSRVSLILEGITGEMVSRDWPVTASQARAPSYLIAPCCVVVKERAVHFTPDGPVALAFRWWAV